MGRKRSPGLRKRGRIWHIDKRVKGYGALCESTGACDLEEAERYLARRLEEIRQATLYGVRPRRTWRQAAVHYLETTEKRSLARDAQDLALLDRWIGHLPMSEVHMGTLAPFVQARRAAGISAGTVNRTLAVARRVLNLAARLWRDEHGLTWLEVPPMIQMQHWGSPRPGHILTPEEEAALLGRLPRHLADMALFALNTGCRQGEVCALRWEWLRERDGTQYFALPSEATKNAQGRPVVLNRTARAVVESRRSVHSTHVFTYRPRRGREAPVERMLNTAWKRARRESALPGLQVHDLRRTFASRLRDEGVPEWTIADLLGHKQGSVTRLYALPTLRELVAAAELLCQHKVALAVVVSGKNPAV